MATDKQQLLFMRKNQKQKLQLIDRRCGYDECASKNNRAESNTSWRIPLIEQVANCYSKTDTVVSNQTARGDKNLKNSKREDQKSKNFRTR